MNSKNCYIENCCFFSGDAGVVPTHHVTSLTIVSCIFDLTRNALFSSYGTGGIVFIGNHLECNGGSYIRIEGHPDDVSGGIIIQGNYLSGIWAGEIGIYLEYVDGVVISGNRIAGTSSAKSMQFGPGVSNVFLSGNRIIGLDPTIPGYELVPLALDDARITQSSAHSSFGDGITVQEAIRLIPTSVPPDPTMGNMYMSAADSTLYVWNGVEWRACW